MRKGDSSTYYRKNVKKKKTWRFFLGSILLQNAVALVFYIVARQCGEEMNAKAHFVGNNFIALTVWLFNLFYPWED
jgi:hydrogenase/urease accessory protein HupE